MRIQKFLFDVAFNNHTVRCPLQKIVPINILIGTALSNIYCQNSMSCFQSISSCKKTELVEYNYKNFKVLLRKYPSLVSNHHKIENFNEILHCIPIDILMKHPWLLTLSKDNFKIQFEEMKKWGLDNSIFMKFIPFMKIPLPQFYKVSSKFIVEKNNIPEGNRILYIAKEMECNVESVIVQIQKYQSILTRNFSKVKKNMEILKEYGIKGDVFLNNVILLMVSSEKLRSRLNSLKQRKILNCLWMIMKKEEDFYQKIEAESNETVHDCLSSVFSEKEISYLMNTNQKLFKMEIRKLKPMLKFLRNKFSSEEILHSSYVFDHNLSKIQERYAELKSFGEHKPRIAHLAIVQKRYNDRIEYLKSKICAEGVEN